jgi:hypothetical protein
MNSPAALAALAAVQNHPSYPKTTQIFFSIKSSFGDFGS